MKLVIDIPKEMIEAAKTDLWCGSPTLGYAIKRGTPYEERPHGEWIDEDYGVGKCWATCSECGESTNGEAQDHGFGYDYSFPNFCPNCGADMREGEADGM